MSVTINGTDNSAALPALVGSDTDTGVFFPAANTMAFSTGATERMRVDSSGNVGIGTASPTTALSVQNVRSDTAGTGWFTYTASATSGKRGMRVDTNNAHCFDYYNGSAWAEQMQLNNSGNLIVANGNFSGYDNATLSAIANGTNGTVATIASSGTVGIIKFTTATTERVRIDSSGSVKINTTASSVYGTGEILSVQTPNGGGGTTGVGFRGTNSTLLGLWNSTSGTSTLINFAAGATGVGVGSISTNGSSTVAYNTSSDYRLKENVAPMQNALSVVQQLRPVTYTWKADNSAGQGFIAHELAEIVPECVTGEKDAVDAEGKPIYQGIDTSFLVATLTAAIQELKTELDATKAEVALLKAK